MSEWFPADYQKKIVNSGPGCALSETFTSTQISKRISFYPELNEKRKHLKRNRELVEKRFALYGWDNTTTVRVYMRETVSRIAAELFYSDYLLVVANVHSEFGDGTVDRNNGHVVVTLRATHPEIEALLEYLREGASYVVYDGERSKYVAGNSEASEFIIVKPDEALQPKRFWRRSQSYIKRIEELGVRGDGQDSSDNRID
jgi:hypothetical protein